MTPMKGNPRIQPQDETPEGKPKSSTSREQPTYDKPEGKPKSVTSEGKPRMTVTVDPHFLRIRIQLFFSMRIRSQL